MQTMNNAVYIAILVVAMTILGIVMGAFQSVMHSATDPSTSSDPSMQASLAIEQTNIDNLFNDAAAALTLAAEFIIFFIFFTSFFGGEEFRLSQFMVDFVVAMIVTGVLVYLMQSIVGGISGYTNYLRIGIDNIVPLLIGNLLIGGLSAMFKVDHA